MINIFNTKNTMNNTHKTRIKLLFMCFIILSFSQIKTNSQITPILFQALCTAKYAYKQQKYETAYDLLCVISRRTKHLGYKNYLYAESLYLQAKIAIKEAQVFLPSFACATILLSLLEKQTQNPNFQLKAKNKLAKLLLAQQHVGQKRQRIETKETVKQENHMHKRKKQRLL